MEIFKMSTPNNLFLQLIDLILKQKEKEIITFFKQNANYNLNQTIKKEIIQNLISKNNNEVIFSGENFTLNLNNIFLNSPLFLATQIANSSKNTNIILTLLQYGANVHLVSKHDDGLCVSPYDLSLILNNLDISDIFVKFDNDLSVQSIRTKTRSVNAKSFNFQKRKKNEEILEIA